LKISSGAVGSPASKVTRESNAARLLAFGDEIFRVKARISMDGSEEAERMAATTELPCVPVAPTTRKVLFAIVTR